MRYHSLPENPFNDPPPRSLLAEGLRLPVRAAVVVLSVVAFAVYLLLIEPFSRRTH